MAQQRQEARQQIDRLLEWAGWAVSDPAAANIHAARGVAIREFPPSSGHGFADYLLYVDGKAAGVIEVKKEGVILTGVEIRSDKQNLVMEYNREMAVADGINVNYDDYRIRTKITEAGSIVEAGYSVQIQAHETRKKRWEELDDAFSYDPNQPDRDVIKPNYKHERNRLCWPGSASLLQGGFELTEAKQ